MEYKKLHLNPEFNDQLIKSNNIFDGYLIDHALTVEKSDHKWHMVFSSWPEVENEQPQMMIGLILMIKDYFKKIIIPEELGDKNISVILRCFINHEETEIFIFIINNKFFK